VPVGRLSLADIKKVLEKSAEEVHVIDVRAGSKNLGIVGLVKAGDQYMLDVIYASKGNEETLKTKFVEALMKGRLLKITITRTSNQAEVLGYGEGITIEELVNMIEKGNGITVPASYYLTVAKAKFTKVGGSLSGILDVEGVPIPLTVSGSTFMSSAIDDKIKHGGDVEGRFIIVVSLRRSALGRGLTSVKSEYLVDPEKRDYLGVYALLPILEEEVIEKREEESIQLAGQQSTQQATTQKREQQQSEQQSKLVADAEEEDKIVKRQLMELMKLVAGEAG